MAGNVLSKILVPLDGSFSSEAILSHLRRIVPPHESHLLLFHAMSFAPWPREQDEPEAYLRRLSLQLANEGYPATPLIRVGTGAETILATAQEEGASLIALTTHGRTGAARLVLGSVAERILQISPLPVLVSRSFPAAQSRGRLEAKPVRNFLVPLDGSPLSLRSLAPILNLTRPVDAHVTLLHVTEASPYHGRWESPEDSLKAADQAFREACIPARIEHRKGDPSEEILKVAVEKDIDLIAMTTHGRSGPSRLVFGSVTANVLRATPVPLLVVRNAVAPEKIARLAKNAASATPTLVEHLPGTGLAQIRP